MPPCGLIWTNFLARPFKQFWMKTIFVYFTTSVTRLGYFWKVLAIFFSKLAQIFGTFFGYFGKHCKSENCRGYFLDTFGIILGCFLFQHLVNLFTSTAPHAVNSSSMFTFLPKLFDTGSWSQGSLLMATRKITNFQVRPVLRQVRLHAWLRQRLLQQDLRVHLQGGLARNVLRQTWVRNSVWPDWAIF